jgi:hypothetical protein
MPTPVPTPVPTPTPVDPLGWLLEHKDRVPAQVTLLTAVEFPAVFNGQVAGFVSAPAGSKVNVGQIEPEFLNVTFGGARQRIPIKATDLRQQAEIAMAKTGFNAKSPAQAAAVQPSETPTVATGAAQLAAADVPADQPTVVVDEIAIGEDQSEQEHGIKAEKSETIQGGLGQPARRLLPGGSHPWEGGTLEWTMKVDPKAQNYVTVKLWGSDKGEESGRLVLFANGLQVGYRHESDYDVLSQCDEEALAPGRFVYVTLPLPPKLTEGKSSLDLKIISIGRSWPYGGPFEAYQKPLAEPTRGIYRAYTHTAVRFVPGATEKQGEMRQARTRSTSGPNVIAESKEIVKDRVAKLLIKDKASAGKVQFGEMGVLAEAYNTHWTPAYRNPRAIDQIVRDGDAVAESFADNPKSVEGSWIGNGPLGRAIMRTWPAIGKKLDTKIKAGSTMMPRGKAWANALRASVDYWRTHRRSYTNQSMIVDANIYTANRALELIDPDRALPEEKALRYLYEATGIEPWLGSDEPGGGSEKPYGAHYYLVSRKGISRELGYVGTYGETILTFAHDMVALTGDEKIREQLRKIQDARLYFRYPAVDAEGNRCMKLVSEIDNRTAHYPLSAGAYLEPNIREGWWMDTASVLQNDSLAVGAAQQSVAEGQYFAYLENRLKDSDTLGMMRNVDEWEKVRELPPSPRRLPMTPGQPDFAFADEENAVLALKHGENCLFINFYYRAERAVNRVARVFEVTPNITRLATVRTDVRVVTSGETYERPDWVDRIRDGSHSPPGEEIHQAWAGEKMPVAKRPDDAREPAYGDWGPFLGKAAFYSLQYGDYLIGMNTMENRSYNLPVPSGYSHAPDLNSGKDMAFNGEVTVPPLSTVVLYLGKECGVAR